MRTVPGVLVDRVNVAGSESGQQSNFFAQGRGRQGHRPGAWTAWSSPTWPPSAPRRATTRSTPSTRCSFTTGGNDVRVATGGLGIGLVTKRGTNSFHGSAGINFAHDDLQWSNLPDELVGDPRLQGNDKADHTDQIKDVSFDLGGPIVKDKLWFYGSYGKNDIRIRRLNQTSDKTLLTNYSAKLNWQAAEGDMVSAFWFLGDKTKIGRAGAAPVGQVLDGTLWNQGDATSSGPPGLQQAGVEPHLRAQLLPQPEGRVLQPGLRPRAPGRHGPAVHRRQRPQRVARHVRRAPVPAPAVHLQRARRPTSRAAWAATTSCASAAAIAGSTPPAPTPTPAAASSSATTRRPRASASHRAQFAKGKVA